MDSGQTYVNDSIWLKRIRGCDVRRQWMFTTVLLLVGMIVGAFLLVVGTIYGSGAAIFAGVGELLVTPIVCAARFNMLRLYLIIQRKEEGHTKEDGGGAMGAMGAIGT
jgi:hypothetical protein